MPVVPKELYYYIGEKPPNLPCRYEDEDGNLDNSIAGATLVAKCKVGENTEFDVPIDNSAGDGTFLIQWVTGAANPSSFVHAGKMRIDIEVDVSAATQVWFMPRFSISVRDRSLT